MFKCYLCGYEGDMKIKSKVNGRNMLLCPSCKLQFMYPQTSDEELSEIYSSNNYPTCSFDNGMDENTIIKMKRKTFNGILKKILPYCSSGNLLDIGCSSGILLEEAKLLGFNVYGLEISKYASDIAKKRIGEDRIYNGTLETCEFNNDFDVITMIDVIEHFRNPIDMLNIAKKMLHQNDKKYGYVLITTPNTDSYTNKIMGKKWPHYNTEHLFYFNLESMKKICSMTGFDILYYSSLMKSIKLDYLYNQLDRNGNNISKLIYLFNMIPIINKINFPFFTGDFVLILKNIL
ncbi:class I SAM-dependent methyltransferase [Brachyspira hyodysenteriae]|uniref:class I SAM-dependent methyltransferase n=1 Tax=Brachyspira hyodysenteriae TaxID=159 RepID=UPI002B260FB3|nr:class I SAM-dependent methyltransferase [Brachyspira hyodysenteriae]WPC36681.1 class I SAM-dependent methyltransferase [Brachyspira hyodysenteriae]